MDPVTKCHRDLHQSLPEIFALVLPSDVSPKLETGKFPWGNSMIFPLRRICSWLIPIFCGSSQGSSQERHRCLFLSRTLAARGEVILGSFNDLLPWDCDLDDYTGMQALSHVAKATTQAYHIRRADEWWETVNMKLDFAAWESRGFLSVQHAVSHKTKRPANLGHGTWAVVRSLICDGEAMTCQCDAGRKRWRPFPLWQWRQRGGLECEHNW